MFKLESCERITGTFNNIKTDWDRYNIETKTPYSTKEYSVTIDMIKGEIKGDCIKYGSQYDLEKEDCIELLNAVFSSKTSNKPLRDFKHLI